MSCIGYCIITSYQSYILLICILFAKAFIWEVPLEIIAFMGKCIFMRILEYIMFSSCKFQQKLNHFPPPPEKEEYLLSDFLACVNVTT